EQGHDHRIQASPIRSMRADLGGVGVALGIAYAITLAIAAAAIGALLHGQQMGALFVGLAGAKAPVIARLLALLAAPLILSPGTSAGPPLRRLSLRLLPVFLLIYIAVTLALLIGDLDATAAALTTAISTAFSSDAAIGGASGGALAALTHAVLRTMMSGPGLGVAAFAPEIAETDNIETAGARAMLGPLLGAGVIGSLTALALLTQGPTDTVVTEHEIVFLEAHQSRALLPSARGQTIVLPKAENTPLKEGMLYDMVLRHNPRGQRVGKLLTEDNLVVLPNWQIAAEADTIVLRDADPERKSNAGYDLRIPCTREVVETRAGPFLKLTPADPTVNLRMLINARGLEGPYVVLDDYHFVGAVERAISGHPQFGEHLALYQPEREVVPRPNNPPLRDILQLGYRGPYVDSDEEPLPPALVGVEGFLPEIGSIIHLRIEPSERGLDIGFINRAKQLETPAWDFLAAASHVVLRHPDDPTLDVDIPVVAREKRDRLRFNTAIPGFSFASMQTMTSHSGPFLRPAALEFAVEVHGDARLPPRYAGRRALIPVDEEGRGLPDLEALFANKDLHGPTLADRGTSVISRAWKKGTGSFAAWAAGLATFGLGIIGLAAWAGVGASSLSQIFGAGAGLVYRLVFVALCAIGGTLSLAEVLGIADISAILAAELHLIGLVALLPSLLARRKR
ncbi:MAG TPA: sodium:alanine symporter family protein, partial [Nannocystis exedens]|nr:sodium:alanine symporter family protein [Nannocystis exedens]